MVSLMPSSPTPPPPPSFSYSSNSTFTPMATSCSSNPTSLIHSQSSPLSPYLTLLRQHSGSEQGDLVQIVFQLRARIRLLFVNSTVFYYVMNIRDRSGDQNGWFFGKVPNVLWPLPHFRKIILQFFSISCSKSPGIRISRNNNIMVQLSYRFQNIVIINILNISHDNHLQNIGLF